MYPKGKPGLDGDIVFTMSAGASNIGYVEIQVVDNDGKNLEEVFLLDVWLSTVKTGVLSTNAPSGNLDINTDGTEGLLVYPTTATTSDHIKIQTTVNGYAKLIITDTGEEPYYVCAVEPRSGRTVISEDVIVYG
jgi:hypothetical protein